MFVPAALIKQYGLRRGDQIDGAARPPGASGPARNGQAAVTARPATARPREPRRPTATLTRVDTVNGLPPPARMTAPRSTA